jgi:cytochrome c553
MNHTAAVSRVAVLLLGLLTVPAALAAGDAAAGKTKTVMCQACHGVDGNNPINPRWSALGMQDIKVLATQTKQRPVNPVWAKLAGQNADYIAKQLQNFRDGVRRDPIMSDMANGLTNQDIADIAAFYAAQPMRAEPSDQGPQLRRGQDIYLRGNPKVGIPACASCHGPNAHGSESLPSLAGQHTAYLQKQLWSFKLGTRTTDKRMNEVAIKLAEDEIEAVAAYLAALRQ